MTPSYESYAVRHKASVVSRGKRELAIELRNHPIQVLALLLDGISHTGDRVSVSDQPAWRSRRPHASVYALCARTGRSCLVSTSGGSRGQTRFGVYWPVGFRGTT